MSGDGISTPKPSLSRLIFRQIRYKHWECKKKKTANADAREIKTLAGVLARFEKITPCSAAQEQLSWKEIACH